MQNQLRLLTAAIMAIPAAAYADASSVILSGTVNVEYTAIKIDQGAAGGGRSLITVIRRLSVIPPSFRAGASTLRKISVMA